MAENKAQIGIALHQMKRGKEFRRLIRVPLDFAVWTQPEPAALEAPDGYDILEFDFAGQEFRWMAVASRDETMLALCAPGEDAHSYMGSQIAQIEYRELIRLVGLDDEAAVYQRKLGKFCIAEGELVLTDRGLVKIEEVSLDMRVWDGVEFVKHDGLIYQGEREVITYAGLTATPDHMVYLQDGSSCEFETAAAQGSSLAKTGDGECRLWLNTDQVARAAARGQSDKGGLPVSEVPTSGVGQQRQPQGRKDNAVQELPERRATLEPRTRYNQWSGYGEGAAALRCDEAALPEYKRSLVHQLRGAWYRVQVWLSGRSDCLRTEGTAASYIPESGHRSQGEQRSLRAGQLEACDTCREPKQQTQQQVCRLQRDIDTPETCISRTKNTTPRSNVCGGCSTDPSIERVKHTSDSGEVVHAKLQTKRTYDLANAGQHHRFTVSNYLVSNCNLSYQYRVGSKTALQKARTDYEMDLDELFIKQSLATYKATYPGVAGDMRYAGKPIGGYWQDAILKAKVAGYAETFAGRRVQLKGSWSGRDAWPMESTAINYPIQGSGADQKYLALAVLRNELNKHNAYFYMELHDGLFIIVPKDRSRKAAEIIQPQLSALPYKAAWGKDFPIQFPVDGKISGQSWGDLKGL